jgi:hypothetical protein
MYIQMFKCFTHFKSGFSNFTIITQDETSVAFITGCFIIVRNKSKIILSIKSQGGLRIACFITTKRNIIIHYYTNVMFRAFAFTNYLKRCSMPNIFTAYKMAALSVSRECHTKSGLTKPCVVNDLLYILL